MAVKSKGSILQQGQGFVEASSMRDELKRLKAEKEREKRGETRGESGESGEARDERRETRGGVGRPHKMKKSVASKRPMQVSTHYTYEVKEKIEDVVRRMKREGVKTASNEELIYIAVSEWLEQNADTFPVEKFLEYRKEVEEG